MGKGKRLKSQRIKQVEVVKKPFRNNKFFKIGTAALSFLALGTAINSLINKPEKISEVVYYAASENDQFNLWSIPKIDADLVIADFEKVETELPKNLVDKINEWIYTIQPGHYQMESGNLPVGSIDPNIVRIYNHKKLSGRKASLIQHPEQLSNYIVEAQGRIKEFETWIESMGLQYPEVNLIIPRSVEELKRTDFNESSLDLLIVNQLYDYELFKVFTDEKQNGRIVNCERELNIDSDKNVNGEIEAVTEFTYDTKIIKNVRVRSYFGHLQVTETELSALNAELSEPLHYAVNNARCKFIERFVNETGLTDKSICSNAGINMVKSKVLEAEEGFVHALTLYYLSTVKGVNIQERIEQYRTDKTHTKYKAVLPALRIIEKIGPEKAISDYLKGPDVFYNSN